MVKKESTKGQANEPKVVSEKPAESQVKPEKAAKPSWNLGRLFWGLLLVLVGSLLLLDNLGVLDVRLSNLWQLWPLLIVAAGFSTLSLRGKLWTALGGLLIVAVLAAAAWMAVGSVPMMVAETTKSDVTRQSDQIKQLELTLKAGASQLNVGSRNSESAVSAELRSNIASLSQTSESDGTTQKVAIETKSIDNWHWRGNLQNELSVYLTRQLPVVMKVEAGASNVDADFSEVKLRSLEVDAGASNISIRLGAKQTKADVRIDSGASALTIFVPKASGVRFHVEGGLNSKSLADLKEVSDGVYESTDYATAANQLTIEGDFGLANITLKRY